MSTPLLLMIWALVWLVSGLIAIVATNYVDAKPGSTFTVNDAFEHGHMAVLGFFAVAITVFFLLNDHVGPLVICRKPLPKVEEIN